MCESVRTLLRKLTLRYLYANGEETGWVGCAGRGSARRNKGRDALTARATACVTRPSAHPPHQRTKLVRGRVLARDREVNDRAVHDDVCATETVAKVVIDWGLADTRGTPRTTQQQEHSPTPNMDPGVVKLKTGVLLPALSSTAVGWSSLSPHSATPVYTPSLRTVGVVCSWAFVADVQSVRREPSTCGARVRMYEVGWGVGWGGSGTRGGGGRRAGRGFRATRNSLAVGGARQKGCGCGGEVRAMHGHHAPPSERNPSRHSITMAVCVGRLSPGILMHIADRRHYVPQRH